MKVADNKETRKKCYIRDLTNGPENPFLEFIGAKLVQWEEGRCEWVLDIAPHHLNSQGYLQGGVTATLMDVACGYSGLFCGVDDSVVRTATISLAVHYMAKACQGRLLARGRLLGGGKGVFFAEAELICNKKVVIATASGSFRRLSFTHTQAN